MFFSSSALDGDEFISVHISVSGNILQMNTHRRVFSEAFADVFLISASLIYSLQVRCVTVLYMTVIGFLQSLAQSHQPLLSLMFQASLCCSLFRQSHLSTIIMQPVWTSLTFSPVFPLNRIEVKMYTAAENGYF